MGLLGGNTPIPEKLPNNHQNLVHQFYLLFGWGQGGGACPPEPERVKFGKRMCMMSGMRNDHAWWGGWGNKALAWIKKKSNLVSIFANTKMGNILVTNFKIMLLNLQSACTQTKI